MRPLPSLNGWIIRKSKTKSADQQKARVVALLDGVVEALVELVHGCGRLERRSALEDHADLVALGVEAGNLVRSALPLAAGGVRERVEVSMELQVDRCLKRDTVGARMDLVKDQAVAGDFLLGAVIGHRLLLDELDDALMGSDDALDRV